MRRSSSSPSVRRTAASLGALVGAAVVVMGSAAMACTNLATLNLSSATGKPGDVITVTGSSFRMPANVTTGVVLRWNGVDGPVLAEAMPDRVGNIAATFTVPQAAPDTYVVVAVLRDARGSDTSGTPARAQFQVVGAAGTPPPAPLAAQGAATGSASSASSAPVALLVVLGGAGLALFGASFVAVARQARRGRVPAPAPVRRD